MDTLRSIWIRPSQTAQAARLHFHVSNASNQVISQVTNSTSHLAAYSAFLPSSRRLGHVRSAMPCISQPLHHEVVRLLLSDHRGMPMHRYIVQLNGEQAPSAAASKVRNDNLRHERPVTRKHVSLFSCSLQASLFPHQHFSALFETKERERFLHIATISVPKHRVVHMPATPRSLS